MLFIFVAFVAVSTFAQVDTTAVNRDSVDVVYGSVDELDWNQALGIKDFEMLDSVSIVSFYRNHHSVYAYFCWYKHFCNCAS